MIRYMISSCGGATGVHPAPPFEAPLDPLWAGARQADHVIETHRVEAGSRLVRNICVYCGSAQGVDLIYEAAARKLGHAMAASGIGLVYGGGANGLMGAIAGSVLANGGRVTGIIPEFLVGWEALPARNPGMPCRRQLA